jgi:hypothetical protein
MVLFATSLAGTLAVPAITSGPASASPTTTSSLPPTTVRGAQPSPTQSAATDLLHNTGAENCTVTALTQTTTRGLFVGLGAQATSSITEAWMSYPRPDPRSRTPWTPWEVTVTQGADVGVKLLVGIKKPPIEGSAMFDAMLGFSTAETYDTPSPEVANLIVQQAKDPSNLDPNALAAMTTYKTQTYIGGDSSIGLSFGAWGADVAVGLGTVVGEIHATTNYTQLISTVKANGDLQNILGLHADASLDLALTQDVLLDPSNNLVGVTDRVNFDDNGGATLGGSKELPTGHGSGQTGGSAGTAPEAGNPIAEGTTEFALTLGSVTTGSAGEVVGTLPLTDPSDRARVAADLYMEAGGAAGSGQGSAVAAAADIVVAIGTRGLVTYRRDHVASNSVGIATDVGVDGLDFSINFTGSSVSTNLVDAEQITALLPPRLITWQPCQQLTTIHLRTIKGDASPGLGATMHGWLGAHTPDTGVTTLVVDPPCPAGAPAGCSGGFPLYYDPGSSIYGDEFQVVGPAEGTGCPLPFLNGARAVEEQSCRVAAMLIVLPHAVDEAAAGVLARSQLPKDISVTAPPIPASQLTSNVQCQTWASPTLSGLPTLNDSGGAVQVAYLSGPYAIQGLFDALLGLGGAPPNSFDPTNIVAIGLMVPNQGRLTLC